MNVWSKVCFKFCVAFEAHLICRRFARFALNALDSPQIHARFAIDSAFDSPFDSPLDSPNLPHLALFYHFPRFRFATFINKLKEISIVVFI